ncbi:NUDIX hydrolase [Novosphingobium marinum]|uniref:8-oxo-dGTP pyrophosphatase MutT (NUDIX family) n=1 Tax=Novosphingobium marinum TaxID=1514948 RepID=A0A7Y9XVN2_9SPHN|nr:NUDIX domain-containing protein [Novosphingobium marinum]NYH95429.1 8-oxo-dGTP pyrophosphatase MutT (NUDIX family) [Novosphingobium marinum]GGC27002.1 NUDIX hydrolase [Novosphingobium marinum]
MSEPIPAATVVIFRNGSAGDPPEILMVERSNALRFAGGAAVFPGGRIDPADHEFAAELAGGANADLAAARIAAIRETLEETGLVLSVHRPVDPEEAANARRMLLECGRIAPVARHFDWRFDIDSLVYFARWCPDFELAFDTRFFLADLGTGAVDIAVDATENSRLFWTSARDALAAADGGDLHVIFPTRRNLERLAACASFESASDQARTTPVTMITPWRERRDGRDMLVIPEGLGYPVTGEDYETAMRG